MSKSHTVKIRFLNYFRWIYVIIFIRFRFYKASNNPSSYNTNGTFQWPHNRLNYQLTGCDFSIGWQLPFSQLITTPCSSLCIHNIDWIHSFVRFGVCSSIFVCTPTYTASTTKTKYAIVKLLSKSNQFTDIYFHLFSFIQHSIFEVCMNYVLNYCLCNRCSIFGLQFVSLRKIFFKISAQHSHHLDALWIGLCNCVESLWFCRNGRNATPH